MIYLDSSCLLKLLLSEPESAAVRQAVAGEADVVVSALTELETTVQLRAGRLGAVFGERRYRVYLDQLDEFREVDPFRFVPLPGTSFRSRFASNGALASLTAARWTVFTWPPWRSSGSAV